MRKVTLIRYKCLRGHLHLKKSTAKRCDGYERRSRIPKEDRIPPGYMLRYDARKLFWDRNILCSASDIGELSQMGFIKALPRPHNNSPWIVRRSDIEALLPKIKKDARELFGNPRRLRKKERPAPEIIKRRNVEGRHFRWLLADTGIAHVFDIATLYEGDRLRSACWIFRREKKLLPHGDAKRCKTCQRHPWWKVAEDST